MSGIFINVSYPVQCFSQNVFKSGGVWEIVCFYTFASTCVTRGRQTNNKWCSRVAYSALSLPAEFSMKSIRGGAIINHPARKKAAALASANSL